jgi:ParB-like chromosome segregation protein Spo0J
MSSAIAQGRKRITQAWPTNDLAPYPNHHLFAIPELTPTDRAALRKDIADNGLEHPLDIWPQPGEKAWVLGGHERYLAIHDLGWKSVDCVVRHDLDTEEKRDAFVMRDNLFRRHLTESQKAALAGRLALIYAKHLNKKDAVKKAAKELSVAPGKVNTREKLSEASAETPAFTAIEAAADRGEVELSTAARAASLPAASRNRVASAFASTRSGEKNKTLSAFTRAEEDASGGGDFELGGEPASLTHPNEAKANCNALDALEHAVLNGCASPRDVVVLLRRAAASMPGKELPALTRFFRIATDIG